ncbi:MAG: hypothetical protein U0326_05310 [Polyangiales bacterium]
MKGNSLLVGERDLVARTTPVRATRQRLAALHAPASAAQRAGAITHSSALREETR